MKTESAAVPPTLAAAVDALVEQDVAKWGEAERAPSRQMHAGKTYGLALNTLYSRAFCADLECADLERAAKAACTAADHRSLKEGG